MSKNTSKNAVHGLRVLIVEDEYFLADDMARLLRENGMEVVGPVPSTTEALELIVADGIGVAILDVNLQDERIYPVADALTARGVPFVFATGYGRDVLPERFAEVPRWEKPFDLNDLARALPALVAR